MKEPFERVVRQHGATVLRVCRAVLGAGADADDAWSETFLSALRAWPDLDGDTNMEAWLVRVARRKAVDVVRSRARRAVPIGDTGEGMTTPAALPALLDEGDPALWQAVADLPERQRLAVAYHYVVGYSHAETAALIGGSATAVRRAAADGIKNLRRVYPPVRAGGEHEGG